jgi:hypothetical protein
VLATEDGIVGTEQLKRRAATRAGAQVAVLEGLNHWWMAEDPGRAAAMLNDFWSTVAH